MLIFSNKISLIFSLVFFGLSLQAQLSSSILSENNREEIQEEIKYLYQDQIEIDIEDLGLFLSNPTFTPYSENTYIPIATTTYMNNEKISFEWPGDSNVEKYAIRWLNLITGEQGQVNTTSSEYTFNNFNDGIHIFLFQARDAQFGGGEFIIIEDKPIMLVLGRNCKCKDNEYLVGSAGFEEDTNSDGALLISWSEGYYDRIYKLDIEVTEPVTLNSSVYINVHMNGSQPSHIGYGNACSENMGYQGAYIFAQNPEFNDVDSFNFLQVSFTDGLSMHLLNPNFQGNISVIECNSGNAPRQEEELKPTNTFKLSVHPNPAKSFSEVSYSISKTSDVELQLVNTLGQLYPVFHQKQVAGIYHHNLNLSGFPSGFYTLQIKTKEANEQQLILITN